MSKLRTLARGLRTRIELRNEKAQFEREYQIAGGDPDLSTAERLAVDWLCEAQDAAGDRGFSWGVSVADGFLPSYPETTGYIIPTLIHIGKQSGNDDLLKRAEQAADWEVDVQMESGAVMGGRVDVDPTPALFNTGQVLFGWVAAYELTGRERFLDAARRAADWMLEVQEDNGNWIRGNSSFAGSGSTLYNVRAAWGLACYGRLADSRQHIDAARRKGEYVVSRQHANGWLPENCLNDPERPLMHTSAYAIEGLIGLGEVTGEDEFVEAAERFARGLVPLIEQDGFLSGRTTADLEPAVSWCCLTGSAQLSIAYSRLAAMRGDESLREPARKLLRYVASKQAAASTNPMFRGGVAGSWPTDGDYGRLRLLNWAAKFFLDAIREDRKQGEAGAPWG